MSKYFNSIITCHRDRRWHLRGFLRSFYLANRHIDKDDYEIVITDMGPSTDKIIDPYRDAINIKQCRVDYDGPFYRSKALNHAVSNAEGEYITVLDIDMLVTPTFLPGIVKFYSKRESNVKVSHRHYFFDEVDFPVAMLGVFEDDFINHLINSISTFSHGIERYLVNGVTIMRGKRGTVGRPIFDTSILKKWYNNYALGTSCFTMQKKIFIELGGYDEKFVDKGSQDKDFNMRAFKYLGGGALRPNFKYSIFSFDHDRPTNRKQWLVNRDHYEDNKKNNVIIIPRSSSWANFEHL